MKILFQYGSRTYLADLSQGIDLSIPLRSGLENPNCFWAPAPEFSPVKAGDFIGSTAAGGPVNFYNVLFNPHGNGTHTECVGHIAREQYTLPSLLKASHLVAKLVSVFPQKMDNGDRVILRAQIEELLQPDEVDALIIRTLPNDSSKRARNYSGANPPYLAADAATYLADCDVEHLLLDLPSVDREEDGGALSAHRAFWRYPGAVRTHCTITEMIYADDSIRDGLYLLNLQTAHFELDASPSRPVIFELTEEG